MCFVEKIEKENFMVDSRGRFITVKIIMTDKKDNEKLLAEKQFGFPDFFTELGKVVNNVFDDSMKIEELGEINQEIFDEDWEEKYEMPNLHYKVTLYDWVENR